MYPRESKKPQNPEWFVQSCRHLKIYCMHTGGSVSHSINHINKKSVEGYVTTDKQSTLTTIKLLRKNRLLYLGRTHGALYRSYGYVLLRFGGNVVRRMGTQQQRLLYQNLAKAGVTINKISLIRHTCHNNPWQ